MESLGGTRDKSGGLVANSSDRLFMELLLHVLVVAVVLIYRAIKSYEAAPEM